MRLPLLCGQTLPLYLARAHAETGKIENWTFEAASKEDGHEGEGDADAEHTNAEEPTSKTATVVYVDYTHARTAAQKLNNAEVGGVKVTAVIKSKDKPTGAKSLKKSRVIVRNLPFVVCGAITRPFLRWWEALRGGGYVFLARGKLLKF